MALDQDSERVVKIFMDPDPDIGFIKMKDQTHQGY